MKILNWIKRDKTYKMDLKSANETLQNVFAQCDTTPNTIPLDKIVLQQKANTRYASIGIYTSLLMLIILLILPAFILQSDATIISQKGISNVRLDSYYITSTSIHVELKDTNCNYTISYAISDDQTKSFAQIDPRDPYHLIFDFDRTSTDLYLFDINGNAKTFHIEPK